MTEKYQPIPHRLKNMAVGGHVAGAVDILDDSKGKNQAAINEEVDIALGNRYTKDEVYNKEESNNIASAYTSQKYATVVATSGTTASDIATLIATQEPSKKEAIDTIYRVANFDGTEYDVTKYSEYTYNGSSYILMDIKSPGIDTQPTKNSRNFVESGSVYEEDFLLKKRISANVNNVVISPYSVQASGKFGSTYSSKHTIVSVEEGETYILKALSDISRYAFATSNTYSSGDDIPLVSGTSVVTISEGDEVIITIPENCTYLLLNGMSQTTEIRKYLDNVLDRVANDIIDVTNNSAKGNVIRANINSGAVNIIPDKYKNALLGADYMYFSYYYSNGYLVYDATVGTHAYVYHVKTGDCITLIGLSSGVGDTNYRAWFVDEYDLNVLLEDSAQVFHKITDTNISQYAYEFLAPKDGDLVVQVPAGISYRALKKVNNEALKTKRHVLINEVVAKVGKAICADTQSLNYGNEIELASESRGASDYIDVSEYTHILTRIPIITAYYLNTPVFGGVFYNENKEPISNLFISERRVPTTLYNTEMTYVPVPEGAKYMRITDITVTGTDNTNPVIRDSYYGVTEEDTVINDEGGISEKYFKDAVIYNMAKKMALSTKEVTLIPRPENCSNLYWRTYQEKNFMYGSAGIYRLSWFPKVFVKGGSNLVINYTGSLEIAIIELGYVPLDSNFYRVVDTATGKINITNLPKIGDEDYTGTYTLSLNKNTVRVVVEIGISNNTTVELAPKDITDYITDMTVICPIWNNMRLEEESAAGSYDDMFDQAAFVGDTETIKPFRLYQYTDIHHDKAAAANVENFVGTYRSRMDAILFTGDLVKSTASESGAKWWREETELPTFSLFTLGNHDGATVDATEYDQKETGVAWDGRGKDWDFEQYFADYIESVGYVMPEGYDDAESPYYHSCFWHKDYADQKVRLIGLDCMHRFDGIVDPVTGEITSPGLKHLTNEQEVWLIEKLNETLDSENDAYGYSVVVACHYPLDDFSGDNEEWNEAAHKFAYNHKSTGGRTMSYKTGAPVNFHLEDITSFNASAVYNMRNRVDNGYSQGQPYPNFTKGATNNMGEILKYWMERGGKFVAWISGHVHRDYMYYSTKYPDILIIACDCAGSLTANHHTKKLQASDLNGISNYYSIDTQNGLIKFVRIGHTLNMYFNSHSYLCYDYINKKVLNEG